jgi:serine/threonine-protein kinase
VLNHPHIAAIYDVREEKGETFLVFEYVEGVTLRQRLKDPISLEEALRIVTQCAEALEAAHAKGIAHHDIKPENIMLTTSGAVKVLDFGVAKGFSVPDQNVPKQTFEPVTHSISGTPAYKAPEMLLEKEADGREDIFSLGVVLYEMLARRHPFLAGSLMGTSSRILKEDPLPVVQLNPQIPPALGRVVEQMLAKDPVRRYASAADLLWDLQAVQSGEPLSQSVTTPLPAPRSAGWSAFSRIGATPTLTRHSLPTHVGAFNDSRPSEQR